MTAANIAVQTAYMCYFLFTGRHDMCWFAGTLLVYRIIDNIDGMHARLTKRTSRLGEFLVRDSEFL
jgi:phosphatidylglycerophosphate synthase